MAVNQEAHTHIYLHTAYRIKKAEGPVFRNPIPSTTPRVRSRSAYGQLTVSLRSAYDQLTVSLRSAYGQLTVSIRSAYGQLTVNINILRQHLNASVHTNGHADAEGYSSEGGKSSKVYLDQN